MNRVLSAYRDVIHEYTNQPNPIHLVYGDDEDNEFRTDLFTVDIKMLKFVYGLYQAHLHDWEFECVLNDTLRTDLEKFL